MAFRNNSKLCVKKVVFDRIIRFLYNGIAPCLVLEGEGGGRVARADRSFGSLGRLKAHNKHIAEIAHMFGLPTVQADGEGEACCATLAAAGLVDAISSRDSGESGTR